MYLNFLRNFKIYFTSLSYRKIEVHMTHGLIPE